MFEIGDKAVYENEIVTVVGKNTKGNYIIQINHGWESDENEQKEYGTLKGTKNCWYVTEHRLEKLPSEQKFKVGDKVRIKDTENTRWWDDGKYIGKIVTITNVPDDYNSESWHPDHNYLMANFYPTDFELVESAKEEREETQYKPKKTIKEVKHMLSMLAKKLLDSDVKALVQAGYLDSELDVTPKGQNAVFAMFFEQNKAELAKRARAELKKLKQVEE